eukprot:UN10910
MSTTDDDKKLGTIDGCVQPLPDAANSTPLNIVNGGIQQIKPEGVTFNDLAKAALAPKELPQLDGDGKGLEDAIIHRLRLAQIPLEFWSINPVQVTYQNYHRLGKTSG